MHWNTYLHTKSGFLVSGTHSSATECSKWYLLPVSYACIQQCNKIAFIKIQKVSFTTRYDSVYLTCSKTKIQKVLFTTRYDSVYLTCSKTKIQKVLFTTRYDSVYLTCSKTKKLTDSQLRLPHGISKKLKCETKNKLMNVISPVQSHYHEGVQ